MSGTRLDITRGVDFVRYLGPEDYVGNVPPAGFFTGSEDIVVRLWPAGARDAAALPLSPAAAWVAAASGIWRLTVPAVMSAALLPGPYRYLATVTKGVEVGELLSGDLIVHASGVTAGPAIASPVADLPTAATLGLTAPVWCSDEDIAVRCVADLPSILPDSNVLASGSDGTFAAGDPWTLTSGSNDFGRQLPAVFPVVTPADPGIWIAYGQGRHICRLEGPTSLVGGSGQALAVAAVAGQGLTLRRLGMGSNIGMAPAPAGGCSGVRFSVRTFAPQIQAASFRINQQFRIDAADPLRTPQNLRDVEPLRQLAVAYVLMERYGDESRSPRAEYAAKAAAYADEATRLEEQLILRWATDLDTELVEPPIFGARYSR